jgi:FG-GAP-like repeat/FG-GAP repeat
LNPRAVVTTGVFVLLMMSGCGGGGGGSTSTSPPPNPPPASLAFATPTTFSSGGIKPGSIAVADFNGDGKLDIAVSNFTSNTISVFLNKGNGTFAAPIVSPVQITALGLGAIAVGDFNEDGKPDLVVATIAGSQADIVLLGVGDGTFQQLPPIPDSSGFFHARVADLNNDGHQDLVTGSNGNISIFLGKGDGTFTPGVLPTPPASGAFLGITVGDFNGDKKLDIVACDLGGTLIFYAGNGDGTFQSPTAVSLPTSDPSALASADFNGDGNLDIMIGFPSGAAIALGNGDGTFQTAPTSLISVYATQNTDLTDGMALQTADFNLDGKPDALVGDYELGVLTLLLNAGIGQFPPPSGTQFQFNLEPTINDLAVGDLNGDGLPDIVVANGTTNEITVILSQKP